MTDPYHMHNEKYGIIKVMGPREECSSPYCQAKSDTFMALCIEYFGHARGPEFVAALDAAYVRKT